MHRIEGNIIDIEAREIFQGSIEIFNGIITNINRHETFQTGFIMPGFIDSHVHIESSMLTPEIFGRLVISHGTVAVVTDPHEIANVVGISGIDFMLQNSSLSPIKTFFTIPSCVPATNFDISGGKISTDDVAQMAASGKFVALSEVMNVPGVLNKEKEVIAKIEHAKRNNLPIDGHAPSVTKDDLKNYVTNNITTDHECTTLQEAKEKIDLGMHILIREGSAAQNYEALKSLIKTNFNKVMFCTDDAHPNEIITLGHINKLVKRAIADGYNLFDILEIACLNPIKHYKLDIGALKIGDKADFIVIDNIVTFTIQQTYINGIKQYDITDDNRNSVNNLILINNFNLDKININSLKKEPKKEVNVIELIENELLTKVFKYTPQKLNTSFESDINNDILKIVYINRYNNGTPQAAFCKGFHLKKGAFATSISHDSHNILAVGCSDKELSLAINAIIEQKGGLSVYNGEQLDILPLPIGGIMSNLDYKEVASEYVRLTQIINDMGCQLHAPFMTLSFMSLLVIPEIKIGERGLFNYETFDWMN